MPVFDYMNEVTESRAGSLEAVIQGFYDSGVALNRMEILERPDLTESVLCVDGVPRFTWRMVHPLP